MRRIVVHSEVTLFGELLCHKTRFYQRALEERGVVYKLAEVDRDREAAKELAALTGSVDKFPTLLIKGRKLRNPSIPALDKELAGAGLFDPGFVHAQTCSCPELFMISGQNASVDI